LKNAFGGSSYYASGDPCAPHSLAVLHIGLFPLQVLDRVTHFTGNHVNVHKIRHQVPPLYLFAH